MIVHLTFTSGYEMDMDIAEEDVVTENYILIVDTAPDKYDQFGRVVSIDGIEVGEDYAGDWIAPMLKKFNAFFNLDMPI